MNKLLTGAIATAAGVALLMGGAGTFATWNSSVSPVSQSITAGNLKVVAAGSDSGTWKVGSTTIDPATYKVIPGQTLTYTKTLQITAQGNALVATLGLAPGSIAAADSTKDADRALATLLTNAATGSISVTTGNGVISGSNGTFTVTAGSAGVIDREITVTVNLVVPNGAAGAENASKTGAVNLSGFAVTLTQN